MESLNLTHKSDNKFTSYLFIIPFLFFYLSLLVYPFLKSFWISFHEWNLLEVAFNPDAKEFTGIKNYVKTLWGRRLTWSISPIHIFICSFFLIDYYGFKKGWWRKSTFFIFLMIVIIAFILFGIHPSERGKWFDKRFWNVLYNTAIFVCLSVPPITIISLYLAISLNYKNKLMGFFRTLFYLSSVVSVAVTTLVWTYMLSPQQGIIGHLYKIFGKEPLVWFTNPDLAMPSIVIATVWWVIGFPMIVFLAALQDIPSERIEAAKIDGANALNLIVFIIIPSIKRTFIFIVLYEIISQFQIFGQSQLMTSGGPGIETMTLVMYIYNTGFRDNEFGKAGALCVLLFLCMAFFSYAYMKISSSQDN